MVNQIINNTINCNNWGIMAYFKQFKTVYMELTKFKLLFINKSLTNLEKFINLTQEVPLTNGFNHLFEYKRRAPL